MDEREQLYQALRNADAAGDTAAAQRLAGYIQSLPAQQAPASGAVGPLKFQTAPPVSPDNLAGRIGAGAALGIADIGRTAMNVLGYLPAKVSPGLAQWMRTKNADFDALTEANQDSTAFRLGRAGGNLAATLPVGGIAGQGIRSVAALPKLASVAPKLETLASSVASSGLRIGSAPAAGASLATKAADMGVRTLGAGISGGLSTALYDPEHIARGALISSVLPGGVKVAGAAGKGLGSLADTASQKLMQSALKPTLAQLRSGDAGVAVQTLLDYGINPTMRGIGKIKDKVGDLNDQIAEMIGNSTATVSKQNVIRSLDDVRKNFSTQVSPTADLNAIQGVADDFMAHPNLVGDAIPVATAQALKQGTYRVLAKKYGQMGSADVEAQKGLARGLKEGIAEAVPGVQGLNAEESRLLTTLNVAERRALMDMNKNPMGLAALASNPTSWAAFMLDKSALFKSLAARSVHNIAGGLENSGARIEGLMDRPIVRTALPAISDRE